jgi:hypothetical protein
MRRLLHDTNGRLLAGLAVTIGLLLPLAVFGAPALARTGASASEYQYSSSSQAQYRITICHLTHSKKHPAHTIRISVRAWKAHQRHGDHLGACNGTEQPWSKQKHGNGHGRGDSASAGASSQGKSHGNGHGKDKGKSSGQDG